jgi:HEAT repeat protein
MVRALSHSRSLTTLIGALALAATGCCRGAQALPDPPPNASTQGDAGADDRPAAPVAVDAERLEQLIAELDHTDQRRVWYAAVELLRDRAAGRAPEAATLALKARLEDDALERRKTILNAIGRFMDVPGTRVQAGTVGELLPALRPFLADADDTLRQEAIVAVAALDRVVRSPQKPDLVDTMLEEILAGGDAGPEAVSAVRVLGRKPPKRAVPKLIDVLLRFRLPSNSEIQAAAFEELYEVTGNRFRSRLEAEAWWEANRTRLPEEWFRERLRKAEADVSRARGAALKWWKRHLAGVEADRERLLAVLAESLDEDIPEIRADAARRLAKLGTPKAYEQITAALGDERTPEVLGALLGALAEKPPEDESIRKQAATATRKLLGLNLDKDVRIRAVQALGALRAVQAIPKLTAMLENGTLDPDVAEAVLASLSRMGGEDAPPVVANVTAYLERELAREPKERRARLIEAALKALTVMARNGQLQPNSKDTEAAVAVVSQLLAYENGGSAAPKVRQLAASALRETGHPAALPALLRALADPDEAVARFVVDAVGAIAAREGIGQAERVSALEALIDAFAAARPALHEGIVDGVRHVLTTAPNTSETVQAFAERLREQAGEPQDFVRLVRLLRDVPDAPPEGAPEAAWAALRALLAESHMKTNPPDGREALRILGSLVNRAPTHRMQLADTMVAAGTAEEVSRADAIYAQLLTDGGAPDALWPKRLAAVRRLVALDAGEQAQALATAILAGAPEPPDAVRAQLVKMAQGPAEQPAGGGEAPPNGGGTASPDTADGEPG